MAQADLSNVNVHSLTRTDALYFTVTVFTTVGFGDITATTQAARLIVTVQMILDLGVLGLGIRVFLGAVQRGARSGMWVGHVGRAGAAFARPVPRRRAATTSATHVAEAGLPGVQG